jgi:hypothetical protein
MFTGPMRLRTVVNMVMKFGFGNDGKFLDPPSDYQLLKGEFASWSCYQ